MKNACLKDDVEYSGVGLSVFDEVCLPYPIFCFTRIVRKILGNALPKMLQYRKYSPNSTPDERK